MSNLDLRFESRDLDCEVSFREYLHKLLTTLWDEGEGFSGKRPFGNSGWDYDLLAGLVANKVINGDLDEYGSLSEVDEKAGYAEIFRMIDELCGVASGQ